MKVVKIVIVGPNWGMGGVERACWNYCGLLSSRGFKVTFIGLIPEKSFFPLIDNVQYIEPKGRNHQKMDILFTMGFVRKLIKKERPDVVLSFTRFYSALVNLALFGTKYPLIILERSSAHYKWPLKIEIFSKLAFKIRKVSGVISQTMYASHYHQKSYGVTKYGVIPNIVKPVQPHNDIPRDKIILAVGRFGDPFKGFDLLVKAFEKLRNTDWKLVFAGGSQEEGLYLLNLVSEDTVNRIVFLGQVKDIDKEYASAGMFVLPSRSEGYPNALCEAMAAGCPCIVFDFPGSPSEIITHDLDGLLVPPEDVDALAAEIDRLISKNELRKRLGKAARVISQRNSAQSIGDKLINFIQEVYVRN